jgi:NAD(P)H-dependent FMN reductase
MMPTDVGVDVVSDNTSHRSMSPPTTPPHPSLAGHRQARRIVRDYIDTLDPYSDDQVMQQTNRHRVYQCEPKNTGHGLSDGSCTCRTSVASTTVLIIPGVSTGAVSRGLTDAAALSSPNGVKLNVFDGLDLLPCYSETLENQCLPRPVVALRNAAIDAHAAMILTHSHGHIPALVHNAIDWLTRRWNQSALHDKPLAVIGPIEDGYGGVWSRHQTGESQRISEARVIEPVTVTTLHEALTRLAEQANIARAIRADSRCEPGQVTELTPEMKLRDGFRAAGADESEVDRLRHELAEAKAQLEELGRRGGQNINPREIEETLSEQTA